MKPLRWTLAVSLFAVLATPVRAADSKVVVELFTSQGCSSCPPADRLLGELAGNSKLVALSLPINYWDYLGWHDTLAKEEYSQRQRGYSEARGEHDVFTPQVIINGTTRVLGSDKRGIEVACEKAAKDKAVPVTFKKSGSNIDVDIGTGSNSPASVWLLSIAQEKPVMIDRGENRGKTITYHNVVRNIRKIADWDGTPIKKSISLKDLGTNDADMIAVLVQSGTVEKPGAIQGAAALSLR